MPEQGHHPLSLLRNYETGSGDRFHKWSSAARELVMSQEMPHPAGSMNGRHGLLELRPTAMVIRARVCSPKLPRLGGWCRHPEVDGLQERLIGGDEGGDQKDERLIAGIAEGMHDPGLLNDPLPGSQHHLGPRRNYLDCRGGPESASPRFAFLVQDGVGNRARLDRYDELAGVDVGRGNSTRGDRGPEQSQLHAGRVR